MYCVYAFICRTRPIVNVNASLTAILRGVNDTLNLDASECGDNPWYVRMCFVCSRCINGFYMKSMLILHGHVYT